MSFKLIGSDDMNSALLALSGSGQQNIAYAPYGSKKFNPADAPLPGFNGERTDPISGVSHLGNGYRAYNPVLMRFNCPDSYSPFGAGGVNAYAYCAGDPINRADPSGHMSWQAGVGIGLGVLSIVVAIFTCGTSIAAAGGVMAAMRSARRIALIAGAAGIAADATGIASAATEESNPHASEALGWASFGLGMVSLGANVADGVHQRSLKREANESMSGSVESNMSIECEGGHHPISGETLRNTKADFFDVEGNLAVGNIRDGKARTTQIKSSQDLRVLRDKSKAHKFIFNREGALMVGSIDDKMDPKIMSHPYLAFSAGNSEVISAGYMYRQGKSIYLVNHSGHYRPNISSLEPVQDYIESLGFNSKKVTAESLGHGFLKFGLKFIP
ncbi:RHS repeat-associated core domain-containing protein [Pseudomonas chlororaphis]|uniref:RHS repeat-associated core domain-containing protein n=1 Tax=Pseudomonas chlororaphis TaxID=587753 RepID=UPI000D0F6B07|nr:RHS repeat-associated core domain-containing protein [Pseudomonas chlororaphis]AVO60077.1 adhesin [Pseudomonas chlororaphis subsp. piscium]UCR83835.1 RHS repeat-associated core domain-containing protein [Pseudomonas chlororaphis]